MSDTLSQEELIELPTEEILAYLEGGIYELLTQDDRYEEWRQVVTALGVRAFMRDHLAGVDRERLLELFSDGEAVLGHLSDYAGKMGVLADEE